MVLLNFLIEMCINEFNDNQQVKRLFIDLYLIIPKAVEVICMKALCQETVTTNQDLKGRRIIKNPYIKEGKYILLVIQRMEETMAYAQENPWPHLMLCQKYCQLCILVKT